MNGQLTPLFTPAELVTIAIAFGSYVFQFAVLWTNSKENRRRIDAIEQYLWGQSFFRKDRKTS
jgi:hypothetical protein